MMNKNDNSLYHTVCRN